jgi:hypothetical protein
MTSSPGCTQHSTAVRMACVAPAVTVISRSGRSGGRTAPRSCATPPGAAPARRSSAGTGSGLRHGVGHLLQQARVAVEVREALAQVDGASAVASADITVKMVVPTLGSRLAGRGCGWSGVHGGSEVVVWPRIAGHRALDQRARQAVGQQFGKGVDEVAQVGAALEGHARDVGGRTGGPAGAPPGRRWRASPCAASSVTMPTPMPRRT